MRKAINHSISPAGGKYSRWIMATILPAMLLSGCSTIQPGDTDEWRNSQVKVLKERAEARWAALIKHDFASAYDYLSPDFRAVVTLQQYKGRIGSVVDWQLARAKNVSYDDPTVASVMMEVTYRFRMPSTGGEIESTKFLDEKWLFKDGNWWYTSK